MLRRIDPTKIPVVWDAIKLAIMGGMSNGAVVDPNLVLCDLLSGILQGWVWIESEDSTPSVYVITGFTGDLYSNERSLWSYSFYANKTATRSIIQQTILQLRDFAEINGCKTFKFHTHHEALAKIALRTLKGRELKFLALEV